MDHKTLFSQTPPTKLFFMAAIPGAIGMLASALYQLIDGVFVGQILGESAFACLLYTSPGVQYRKKPEPGRPRISFWRESPPG